MADLIEGLDDATAAARLLAHLGVCGTPPEGRDAGASMLERLDACGLTARLVQTAVEDLCQLDLPALAGWREGKWLVVIRSRRGYLVEGADGTRRRLSSAAFAEHFDGRVVDRIPEIPHGAALWSRVARVIGSQRRTLLTAGVLALAAQGFGLLTPVLTRELVDRAFPNRARDLLWVIVGGMVLVALFQAWIGWLERRFAVYLQVRIDAVLERGLFAHVLRLPHAFTERKSLGQLLQAFHGLAVMRDLLTGEVLSAVFGGITACAFMVLMVQLLPWPAVLVGAISVVTLAIVVATGRRQVTVQEAHVAAQVRQRQRAAELLTRIAMYKAAGAEQRAVADWATLLKQEREIALRGERLELCSRVASDALGQAQLQGLWIWGGWHVLSGSLQLGELVAFTMMAGAFHAALSGCGRSLVAFLIARPQLGESEALLAQTPLPRPLASAQRVAGRVDVRDLWFRYGSNQPWVLSGYDLSVPPGDHRRIEGPSGFGKTTLLKIIAGLYVAERGQVTVDGHAVRDVRHSFIYLPQFVYLFNTSLLENLRLFSAGASYGQLMSTAEITGLTRMVKDLPMGYETLLAQGGANFSGGQRQLIALTGVLASNRRILLLDEVTANLDGLRAAALAQTPLLQDRTILYTSHTVSLRRPVRADAQLERCEA
jgi:ATP-binding cassette, subfamily B, bacterial